MSGHALVEQLTVFREMAAEARREAERATSSELRQAYEQLAASWNELIDEIVAAKESRARRLQSHG